MKKITFILIALITGTAFAQSADGTATVNAEIVSPITITNSTSNLDFGNIATPEAATDIVVSTDGTRTAVDGVTIPGGTVSAASFSINAANGYAYSVTIDDIDLTGTGGADMKVIFSHNRNSDLGRTGSGSAQPLNVGGTLKVGASQGAGSYTGTAKVTVAYE